MHSVSLMTPLLNPVPLIYWCCACQDFHRMQFTITTGVSLPRGNYKRKKEGSLIIIPTFWRSASCQTLVPVPLMYMGEWGCHNLNSKSKIKTGANTSWKRCVWDSLGICWILWTTTKASDRPTFTGWLTELICDTSVGIWKRKEWNQLPEPRRSDWDMLDWQHQQYNLLLSASGMYLSDRLFEYEKITNHRRGPAFRTIAILINCYLDIANSYCSTRAL